jgi:hypothetical protein
LGITYWNEFANLPAKILTQLDRQHDTMPGIMTKVQEIVAMSRMFAIMAMKSIVAMSGMSAIMAMANSIVAMSPWSSIVAMVKSLLGPQGETASVVTPLNTELAEKEERPARIVSELIARHEDEKDKIRAASMRQEELLSLVRHEMAALGANVNDRMQMMTRNTLRMADCNAQLIMATRAVVEQNQVSATPGKLNPSPLIHAPP